MPCDGEDELRSPLSWPSLDELGIDGIPPGIDGELDGDDELLGDEGALEGVDGRLDDDGLEDGDEGLLLLEGCEGLLDDDGGAGGCGGWLWLGGVLHACSVSAEQAISAMRGAL